VTYPTNPTSASAVIGERLRIVSKPGIFALLKGLTMPIFVAAFATYLLIGLFTMRVPPNVDFPGPQFFPGIIVIGLYGFAVVLAVSAVREVRSMPDPLTAELLAEEAADARDDDAEPRAVRVDVRSLLWVIVSFLGFALLLDFLGWVVAASLLFWCIARGFGSSKPVQTLIVGVTIASLTYIAFDMALGLPLPSGILGGF
jgi:hypothetical protein